MGTKFEDYAYRVKQKAIANGPESVARLEAFNAHFAMARDVRARRQACNLTQQELAEKSGVNQAEISRIERAQTNPTAMTLAALLTPLGARLGVIMEPEQADRNEQPPRLLYSVESAGQPLP